MMKTFIQGAVVVALFFSTWFVLSRADWMTIFKVKRVTHQTEEKLGELFWDIFKKAEKENKNSLVNNAIDSIVDKVCTANKIDRELIKVHVLDKEEINAFALPDGHLVVYSGLIAASDNAEEVCGVLCHEIAHIRHNHVMKKLVKEIGLSALIAMTAGNGGGGLAKEASKMLSSSAFDRKLEKEADINAVDYLVKAGINPEPFANFLYKLADKESDEMKYLSWVSTHPESKERAAYIVEYSNGKTVNNKPALSPGTWDNVKAALEE